MADKHEEWAERVHDLEDLVHELTVSVQYNVDEPYAAELARSHIAGQKRVQVQAVINGLLARAEGEPFPSPNVLHLPQAVVDELTKQAPLDRDQAVAILGTLCGHDVARRLLDAHRERGLGLSGHRALDQGS